MKLCQETKTLPGSFCTIYQPTIEDMFFLPLPLNWRTIQTKTFLFNVHLSYTFGTRMYFIARHTFYNFVFESY